MKSNSKPFNKPSAVIFLYQLKITALQTQNDLTSKKFINYVFSICNSRFSFI